MQKGIIGSFVFCRWCSKQIVHLAILPLIWEFTPGQYNTSIACRLDFSIPMWPWRFLSSFSFLMEGGTRILSLLRLMSSSSESSFLASVSRLGYLLSLRLCFWSFRFYCFFEKSLGYWPLAVACLSSSSLDFETSRWTCSAISSFMLSCAVLVVVLGKTCLVVPAPYQDCIPMCSRTFAFEVEFSIVVVVLLSVAFRQLTPRTCGLTQ